VANLGQFAEAGKPGGVDWGFSAPQTSTALVFGCGMDRLDTPRAIWSGGTTRRGRRHWPAAAWP